MTTEEFRSLALKNPGAFESEHVGHPDFRFNGKVFATLGYPSEGWAMVKLTPEQQRSYLKQAPGIFHPAGGAWGKAGSTTIALGLAKKPIVRAALAAAFGNLRASREQKVTGKRRGP